MWDGGKGWEKAVHMPSCVTCVTKKHFMFVKQTLTYLAVTRNVIQWRRGQDSGEEGGRGEDRGLGKALPGLVRRGFRFLVCYAATQLATQLPQRRIQVVRSNKVARKRLTESNGTPAMDLGLFNGVLK